MNLKIRKIVIILTFLIITITVVIVYLANIILNTLPDNSPHSCINNQDIVLSNKIMVNVGDSITHGVVSANYSEKLSSKINKLGFTTINAGINADLSITVLRRIDEVIMCNPTVVTVLVGTNDIVISHDPQKRFIPPLIGRANWDDIISIESYENNMLEIVSKLQEAGVEKIILISPPLLGEDINSSKNLLAKQFSETLKRVALLKKVRYIPLNEIMGNNLLNAEIKIVPSENNRFFTRLGFFRHYFLSEDLDKVYDHNGYYYLTDGVHLNSRGSDLVAQLIYEEIHKFEN